MKLSKLYCNAKGFKNTTFNLNGLNVVYADVASKIEDKKNSHDLGKTKFAEILDFLFLKEVDAKRHFLFKIKDDYDVSIFHNYIFYLELLLNSGQYLTIKRGVANNTKISFSLNEQQTKEYFPPANWELENIGIKQAKKELSKFLALDFFHNKSYDFRKAINYCLRSQNDYDDVYKLSKYAVGKDKEWKPFMFDLLGFNGKLLTIKYNNDEQREEIKNYIDKLKNEYSVKTEDRDDIVAQIKLIENDSKEIEERIDQFNFYEQDKELINKGIEEIETSISNYNTLAYNLSFEIDKLRKSITNNFSFNLDKVQKVFEESELYFPEQLKHDYERLISFNKSLTIERNKLLKKSLNIKEEELRDTNVELQKLNNKKEELLSYLRETDAFRKFKFYQKELVKIEGQLITLKEKLKTIDIIINKEKERGTILKEIEGTVDELRNIYQHTENNSNYSDIRTKFSNYYKKIMDEDARISWNINTNNNVDFLPPKVQTKGELIKDTAKDEGNTYRKLLCVAFDLAVLCSYNQESFFRFVYHDDVLSQQDNGIKNRLLELVRDLTKRYNLQYILSVIKSDLPIDGNEKPIYFSNSEIILRLHDKDQTGTLFGFEF